MSQAEPIAAPKVPEAAHEIPVGGPTLRVATWGEPSPDRPAVLLVHGLTANSRCWADLGPLLAAQGWFAVAPDLRGRGLSDKPPYGYGPAVHAADLLAVADALGLGAVHFVGHSLGATIGLYLAAVHRSRLARLVVVDGGGKPPADTVEAIAPALARLGTIHPSLDAYLEAMRASPAHPWDAFWERYYRYDAEVHPDGTARSRVPKAAIDEELAALWTTRTESLPDAVRVPTLIVRATVGLLGGERGQILTAAEAERIRRVIPESGLLEIPDTNHYTVLQSPLFARAVTDWLRGGDPRPPA